jgi:heme o synthase
MAKALSMIDTTENSRSKFWEYVTLTKPRISLMVLLTVATAAFLATQDTSQILVMVKVVIGVFFVSASGSALNQYLERYTDFLMPRTRKRPLPAGKLSASDVALFGAITFGIGFGFLLMAVNWQAAFAALLTWVLYVWVYTPLKTRTWTNTIIGAIPGAMPVIIGDVAVNGSVSYSGWVFFAVLFLWQFPHFMAIAWLYRDQYKKGGHMMLPVVDPTGRWAGVQAVVTAVLLVPASLLTVWSVTSSPWILGTVCAVISGIYLLASIAFAMHRNQPNSKMLLRISLLYLPIFMVAWIIASVQ